VSVTPPPPGNTTGQSSRSGSVTICAAVGGAVLRLDGRLHDARLLAASKLWMMPGIAVQQACELARPWPTAAPPRVFGPLALIHQP
jgi:hypothetical protein